MALQQQIELLNRSNNPTATATTLMELGNHFFNRGRSADAMSLFEAAHLALRNPSDTALSKQEQVARELLSSHVSSDAMPLSSQPADTYQEDECDVGPRQFREPLLPAVGSVAFVHTLTLAQTEAFILYNKALVAHSRFDFNTATTLYNQILQGFARSTDGGSFSAFGPKLLQLLMFVNNNMGQIAYIEGSEETALAYFETALLFAKHLANEAASEVHLATATVLSNFCRVHWMSGDVSESIYSALCEVLRIRSSVLEATHMDVASAHYNLGVAEYARRNNESAIRHLMRYLQVAALRAQQEVESDLDPVPALVYILLMKNEDKEDDNMAQELVRGLRTLQDKRNDLGPQHPEIASIFNFVGTLLFHQRDFDHALLFFQEELRLEEAFLGHNEDVSVSVTCNNIGRILQELQRLPEAIRYYNRALQAEYGDEMQLIANKSKQPMNTAQALARNENLNLPASTMNLYSTVWYNLGLIHDKQGSYPEAIHAFQMSLGLRRVMLGKDHPDVACLLYNIGVLQMEQQLLKDSTDSFREALRIRRVAATGQLNDCHVVKTLQKLASLHKSSGNIEGALEAGREILHIQQLSPDFDASIRHKEMGSTLKEMAELYHALGNVAMAVIKAKESVAVLRQAKVESHNNSTNSLPCVEELFSSLLLLGSLYHENCEPAKAFALFSEASAMIQTAKTTPTEHTTLQALHEVSQMLATCHCAPIA